MRFANAARGWKSALSNPHGPLPSSTPRCPATSDHRLHSASGRSRELQLIITNSIILNVGSASMVIRRVAVYTDAFDGLADRECRSAQELRTPRRSATRRPHAWGHCPRSRVRRLTRGIIRACSKARHHVEALMASFSPNSPRESSSGSWSCRWRSRSRLPVAYRRIAASIPRSWPDSSSRRWAARAFRSAVRPVRSSSSSMASCRNSA